MGRREKRRSEGRVAFHMEKAAVYNLKIFKFSKVGIVMVRKSVVLWKMEHKTTKKQKHKVKTRKLVLYIGV